MQNLGLNMFLTLASAEERSESVQGEPSCLEFARFPSPCKLEATISNSPAEPCSRCLFVTCRALE